MKTDIHKLIKYKHRGVIPEQPVTAGDIAEWELRIQAAHVWGMTDEDIEKKAKKLYEDSMKGQAGAGAYGWETWEKNARIDQKFYWVGRVLPQVQFLKTDLTKTRVIILQERS